MQKEPIKRISNVNSEYIFNMNQMDIICINPTIESNFIIASQVLLLALNKWSLLYEQKDDYFYEWIYFIRTQKVNQD